MPSDSEKYWYNLTTGEVERGFVSAAVDRAGPFETAAEAARAPEIIQERSRAWAEEERREDEAWSSSPGDPSADTRADDQN